MTLSKMGDLASAMKASWGRIEATYSHLSSIKLRKAILR